MQLHLIHQHLFHNFFDIKKHIFLRNIQVQNPSIAHRTGHHLHGQDCRLLLWSLHQHHPRHFRLYLQHPHQLLLPDHHLLPQHQVLQGHPSDCYLPQLSDPYLGQHQLLHHHDLELRDTYSVDIYNISIKRQKNIRSINRHQQKTTEVIKIFSGEKNINNLTLGGLKVIIVIIISNIIIEISVRNSLRSMSRSEWQQHAHQDQHQHR